jgi:hypothetical protein
MLANYLQRGRLGVQRPFGHQPLYGHSVLRSRLVLAALFNEQGAQCRNAIDSYQGVFTGSSKPSWSDSYLSFPGGANTVAYLNWGTEPQTQDLHLGPFTIAARIFWKGGDGGLVERNDNNNVAGWMAGLGSTANKFGLTIIGSGANMDAYAAAPSQNKWVNVAVVYNGTFGAASNISIYYDGILQSLTGTQAGTGSVASDVAQSLFCGRNTFTGGSRPATGSFNGLLEWMYIWKRAVTQSELFGLQSDGYILWHPANPLRLSAPSSATVFTANLTASVSPSGAIANKPTAARTASVSPSASIASAPAAKLSASVSPGGGLKNKPITNKTASVSPGGAIKTTLGTRLAASVTPSATLSKTVKKTLAAGVSPVGSLVSRLSHSLAGSVAPSGRISAGVGEAPCNIPLSDLRQRLWDLLDDNGGAYYTPAEVAHALNMAQRLFVFLTFCLEKTVIFNLTNGVYEYSIRSQISDFLAALRVSWINPVGSAKVRLLSDNLHEMDARDSTWRARAGNPLRYSQQGFDTFWITPQPASGVHTLQFTYAREPLEMVLDNDVPEIPPDEQIHLPDAGFYILRLKEGGQELANAVEYFKRFMAGAQKYQSFMRARSRGPLYDHKPLDLMTVDLSRWEIKLQRPPAKPPKKQGGQKPHAA